MPDNVRLFASVIFRASLLLAVWPGFCFAAGSPAISIRWNTNSNPTVVEIVGVPESALRQLQSTNQPPVAWQKLFPVYAGEGPDTPAMLGDYGVEGRLISFRPRFPLEHGLTYRAVFQPDQLPGYEGNSFAPIVSRFVLPATTRKPTTVVSQIYPSADVLPENLLKFYVHFSAPMQGGHIYDHVHLRDEKGKPIELPFLEIDEELWDPGMTRITLLIDPGRIKRGVKPLVDIGLALEAGKRFTLEIDAAWLDNAGLPLRESFLKAFRVGPPDRDPPSLTTWKISPSKAGTRAPLTVTFPKPMDHALALRLISVSDASDHPLKGTNTLSDHEKRWTFTPTAPWIAGRYQLCVQNTIEDLAGNNIGKAFDVDVFETVQPRFTNTVLNLPFDVR
jgi:hypothetical protein